MEHVGRLLKRIHMIMDRNFNNMLNQYDLTAAQLDVLMPLDVYKRQPYMDPPRPASQWAPCPVT